MRVESKERSDERGKVVGWECKYIITMKRVLYINLTNFHSHLFVAVTSGA